MPTSLAAQFTSGMVNGVIGQEIRMKVYNQGKIDYEQIAADAFGNALANSIVDKLQNAGGEQKLKDEQAAKQAVENSKSNKSYPLMLANQDEIDLALEENRSANSTARKGKDHLTQIIH